ncbi:uncharacterized protein T551_02595 [Pneumocystis jirovecii RU7]|uniref:Uncharacterized protein n=1 Tax=Pneumocystis jirovecii (strain RU7) TaxID=1408657 RepID=A0A0W4ZK60_PNEJ7|nr:uncharacterized protein T551_02595 [Pneumocystis jirovecii RU7]KTW28745.1 hypothetical protein T551_02595 [Pneumocystis jirovecii RU7]
MKKKIKKVSESKSDSSAAKNFEKFTGKTDKHPNESKICVLETPKSLCSHETKKRFSFFGRICRNKTGKSLEPHVSREGFSSESVSKINADASTFCYSTSTISFSPKIYNDTQYVSPSNSIFDKSHVFERSVDYSSLTFSSPSTSVSITPSVYKMCSADSIHQQRIVDNHVPTVLDASMEILNDSTNMDNIEIVSIKRLYSPIESFDPFQLKDSWTSYASSLYTRETSLSFVSYADLVNVDHCETFSPILTVTNGSKLVTLSSDPEHISLEQTLLGEGVKRLLFNSERISNG